MELLVVLNPSARDFKAQELWPSLRPYLEARASVELLETEKSDDATKKKLKQALRRATIDRVVAIGGDGTVHLVVNQMMGAARRPELGIIPFGTANDVAKSFRLPLDDFQALAQVAQGDRTAPLDIGEVRVESESKNRRAYFVDAVTIGMDADVLAAREKYRSLGGYAAYMAALAERSMEQRSIDARVVVDDATLDVRMFNAIINNVPVYAGELEMPNALAGDGKLDVYLFNRLEYASKLVTFAIKQADVLGLGVDKMLEEFTQNQRELHGRSARIRLASPKRVQVDGELFGEADEVEASIAGQLAVAVPGA